MLTVLLRAYQAALVFLLCPHTSVEFRRQPSGVSSLFPLWVPAVKLSSSGFHCAILPAPITFCAPVFHCLTAGGDPLTHSQVVPQFLHFVSLASWRHLIFLSPLRSLQCPHYFFPGCLPLRQISHYPFLLGYLSPLAFSLLVVCLRAPQDSCAIFSVLLLETVLADTSAAYVGPCASCSWLLFLACLFLPTVLYLPHSGSCKLPSLLLNPPWAFPLGFPLGHFLQLKHVHSHPIPTITFLTSLNMVLAYLRTLIKDPLHN